MEASSEVLVIFKTTKVRLTELEALIRREHPYEVPQIVALPIYSAGADYLEWMDQETHRQTRKGASPQKSL